MAKRKNRFGIYLLSLVGFVFLARSPQAKKLFSTKPVELGKGRSFKGPEKRDPTQLTLISWNALNFGNDKGRKLSSTLEDKNVDVLKVLANEFSAADVVALQEVNTKNFEETLDLLRLRLEEAWGEGETACWGFSQRGSKNTKEAELFAYIWRDSRVAYVTTNGKVLSCKGSDGRVVYINMPIMTELEDKIGRPPSYATFLFRPQNLKFNYINLHLRPSGKKPQEEVGPLFQALDTRTQKNKNEFLSQTSNTTFISGDFNLSDAHPVFQQARDLSFEATFTNQKTSLHMKKKELNKAYDNIWYKAGKSVQVSVGDKRVIVLYDLFPKEWDQKYIFHNISDHCPIEASYKISSR